jgi:hypothetical protein
MKIFSGLGLIAMLLAFLLRRREASPAGCGLESITAGTYGDAGTAGNIAEQQ